MRKIMCAGLLASLMGCIIVPVPVGVSKGQASPREQALPVTVPAIQSFEKQFRDLRAANGLPALRPNSGLDAVALAHSQDMTTHGYLAHVDRSGKRAQGRVRAAGVTRCGIGENLAKGQGSVERVIADWMASPGHRRNMLNRDYASYGIGRVNDTWTLVFALPC